jgi:hypothetical protein
LIQTETIATEATFTASKKRTKGYRIAQFFNQGFNNATKTKEGKRWLK